MITTGMEYMEEMMDRQIESAQQALNDNHGSYSHLGSEDVMKFCSQAGILTGSWGFGFALPADTHKAICDLVKICYEQGRIDRIAEEQRLNTVKRNAIYHLAEKLNDKSIVSSISLPPKLED